MKTEIVKQASSHIDGSWITSNEKISLKTPADLYWHIKDIYFASAQDAKKSIISANIIFDTWKTTSIDKRI